MLLANETVATSSRGSWHAVAVPHSRAAGRAESRAVRGVHRRVRLFARGASRSGAAPALSTTAREAARQARRAADCVPDAPDHAESEVRRAEPRAFRSRGRFIHALHVADSPLSRSDRPSHASRGTASRHRRSSGSKSWKPTCPRSPGTVPIWSGAPTRPSASSCSGRKCDSWPTKSAMNSTATLPASPRSVCSFNLSSTTSRDSCTCRAWRTTTTGFLEKSHSLRGENTQKVYQLGDRVRVQVVRVDMDRRQIDLGLVEILEAVRS